MITQSVMFMPNQDQLLGIGIDIASIQAGDQENNPYIFYVLISIEYSDIQTGKGHISNILYKYMTEFELVATESFAD